MPAANGPMSQGKEGNTTSATASSIKHFSGAATVGQTSIGQMTFGLKFERYTASVFWVQCLLTYTTFTDSHFDQHMSVKHHLLVKMAVSKGGIGQ